MSFSRNFEKTKNKLVKFFMMKRGRYNRPFLHFTTMAVLGLGVMIAPFLADTYPVFSQGNTSVLGASTDKPAQQSIVVGENVFQTDISQKPRDKVITYTVEKGDTLSTISQKFGISADTIRWANDMTSDDITPGDQLKILPVTGIAYKVQPGDTVYTIAKTFATDPQKIVDFPFNDFANPETFSLISGEILIVPDGVKPSDQPAYSNQQQNQYVAQGPAPAASGGGWFWPVGDSIITQYFSWYHSGVDIAGPIGTPVYAAHSGTVERVSVGTYDTGYGTNVWVSDGDGIETHYAHLNAVNVSEGQSVIGGQSVVGWRGNTGRSTGPHTHFEIRVNGTFVNPMLYVHP